MNISDTLYNVKLKKSTTNILRLFNENLDLMCFAVIWLDCQKIGSLVYRYKKSR